MRKKLAGIHLLAPLSETDIVDYSRNLDRELIVNSTIVTDAIVDTVEKTNYIVTFEYDTTLDGGTHQIRRSIPTLELLSYTGENMSGAHWVNVEDMDYHYITPGTTTQQAFEELDEQISKLSGLKYIIDGTGIGTLVSSTDGKTPSVSVDTGEYVIALGESHTTSNTEHSVILGGVGSDISASLGSMSRYNLITSAVNGRIQGNGSSSSIYGGIDNYILGDLSVGNTIINGRANLIYGAIRESTIINGSENKITMALKYGYADSVMESTKGYILDSEYSSINHSARISVMDSRYASVDHSAYIQLNNVNHCSVNSSEYTSILDSSESNIINSANNSDGLNIYSSYFSNIQNSANSHIWGSISSSIICSDDSSIGYRYVPDGISSTGKTYTSLIFNSVSGFTLGQMVMLIGAEYTSTISTYQIAEIDENTKSIRFVNESYTYITFDTGNLSSISMHALNIDATIPIATILSNTSDTIVVSSTLVTNQYPYSTIDGYTQKYNIVDALGSNVKSSTIKLRLFESNELVTNLVPNSLVGKNIRQYNIHNINNSMILGGTDNHIYSGAYTSVISSNGNRIMRGSGASIIACEGNTISDFNNSVTIGSNGNYISGSSNAIIIANGNYITSSTYSSIIGGAGNNLSSSYGSTVIASFGNYVNNCDSSTIINGNGNYIENDLVNVSMIACNATHATRSNVLMTPSLTLVDKTLELNGSTPSIGDVLVVESFDGNVATVTWGKPASANSLFQSLTYTMWGESVISHAYISVGPDDAVSDDNMAVDLNITGVINTDYMSEWNSTYIANSNAGITIEDGCKHVISFDSFDAKWVNASANAPIVSMTAPKITIIESNNEITYTTSAGGFGTLLDSNAITGIALISGFSVSGSSKANLNLHIHRPSVNDPAIVTFSTININESSSYANAVVTPIYIDANGMPYVYWPVGYALPTVGEYAWFKSPDAQLSLNSYWWRAIVSVNPNTRLVRIDGNSLLRVSSQFDCYLWYMKESPRFKVTANISMVRISTAI